MRDHFLWVEKYRPKTIAGTILPERLKSFFQSLVDKGEMQNLLLVGGPGTGKTTVARAMCEELGNDYIVINASENGGIDTLRTTIRGFASSVSLNGKIKVVILDEADFLNPNSTQPSLRNFMEEFSLNCRFILTANYANKILDPIKSRCSVIEFSLTKDEKFELLKQFDQRVRDVLTAEGITFDKSVLAEVIMRYFPDFRKIFNELQRFSHDGSLNAGVMNSFSETALVELIKYIKASEFTKMRKWVADNVDNDFTSVVRSLYDGMYKYVEADSIPELVLILADFDYKRAFVTDMEIHLVAMLTTIMMQVKFK